ncbi:hypothetical protein CY35_12G108100 [Sphagnum magellanicum]|nr:hypothetical protein CY35_12G108100 [Sphagnum magellanicum]
MASSKESTNVNTPNEVTTHAWKKKTASVSGSGSPKDNVHSYGDIGPSRYKPPAPGDDDLRDWLWKTLDAIRLY